MTNEIKKTVVELIFQEMLEIQQSGKTLTFDENLLLLEKYKEMEKEKIKKVWDDGVITATYGKPITFEQYYNKTYGNDKQ